MEIPPGLRTFLDRLGFNTTRLQWKLYEWEKKRARAKERPSRLPDSLHWMRYQHKFCLRCNALNDRNDTVCHKCGARLSSVAMYRVWRFIGWLFPTNGTPVVMSFIGIILLVFALALSRDGFAALRFPSPETTLILGAYYPAFSFNVYDWWRAFAFALVHGGALHIGFNVYCLFQIGPILESLVRPARMIVIITVTQLTSAIGTYVWYVMMQAESYASTVGASGVAFGLIGFGIANLRRRGPQGQAITQSLVQWAIFAGLFGLFMRANNAAHAGGFVGGLLLGLLPDEGSRGDGRRVWNAAAVVCLVIWVVVLGYQAYSIATGWAGLDES